MLTQLGISPKVFGPFLLSMIGAAVLYLVGQHDAAFGAASAAAVHLTTGYALPPGGLSIGGNSDGGPASDDDLDPLTDVPTDQVGTNPPTGAPAPTVDDVPTDTATQGEATA